MRLFSVFFLFALGLISCPVPFTVESNTSIQVHPGRSGRAPFVPKYSELTKHAQQPQSAGEQIPCCRW